MVDTASSLPDPGLFRIPAAAVARHPRVILTPRELRAWIDALPLANPPRSAQMLQQQLRLLVRDPQPGARFASLLEMYVPPLEELLRIAQERMQNTPDSVVPLDQLEYELVELLTELAQGYLRLANEQLQARKAPAADILYRPMHLLDSAADIARTHYHGLRPDSWRLMVAIFLRGEHQRIGNQPVAGVARLDGEPNTLQGLFYRALVINLCDPHRHRPSEVHAWRKWISQHAGALNLTMLPQGAFAIPIDVSGATPPLTGARRGKPGPNMRYLAADDFLQRLKTDPTAPPGLHAALLDVIKGRKTPEQRQSPRQARNHPYRLLYGLRTIHRRLVELIQGDGSPSHLAPIPCRQINQSKGGSAFHLQGPLNPPLSVGEPVLAEADTAGGGTPVGFAARVQRMVSNEHQQIEIGVEKLDGRLIPVHFTGHAAERGRGDTHALLVHATDSGRFTLLAARNLLHEGDIVSVEGPSTRYNLRVRGITSTVHHVAYLDVEITDA